MDFEFIGFAYIELTSQRDQAGWWRARQRRNQNGTCGKTCRPPPDEFSNVAGDLRDFRRWVPPEKSKLPDLADREITFLLAY